MTTTMPVNVLPQSSEVSEIVGRARAFAAAIHEGQRRTYSDEPYVVHLDAVAGLLRSFGITEPAVLAAAYLHDTVEDTDVTIEDIYISFGERIAELVYWLTDAEQGRRRMRKMMSAWRLGRAPWGAKMIKLADLIDNAEDLYRKDLEFAPIYLREGRNIVAKMLEVEGDRLANLAIFKTASSVMSRPL